MNVSNKTRREKKTKIDAGESEREKKNGRKSLIPSLLLLLLLHAFIAKVAWLN